MLKLADAKVESSGLTPQQAVALGMYSIDSAVSLGENFNAGPALVIPYYNLIGKPLLDATIPFFRVRYLEDNVKGFTKKQRYSQPLKSGAHAYFPRSLSNDSMRPSWMPGPYMTMPAPTRCLSTGANDHEQATH